MFYIPYIDYINVNVNIFFIDFRRYLMYVIPMTAKKAKVLLVAEENLIKRIDDFRFTHRINSRSEAMRRLLDEALKRYEKKLPRQ